MPVAKDQIKSRILVHISTYTYMHRFDILTTLSDTDSVLCSHCQEPNSHLLEYVQVIEFARMVLSRPYLRRGSDSLARPSR